MGVGTALATSGIVTRNIRSAVIWQNKTKNCSIRSQLLQMSFPRVTCLDEGSIVWKGGNNYGTYSCVSSKMHFPWRKAPLNHAFWVMVLMKCRSYGRPM